MGKDEIVFDLSSDAYLIRNQDSEGWYLTYRGREIHWYFMYVRSEGVVGLRTNTKVVFTVQRVHDTDI